MSKQQKMRKVVVEIRNLDHKLGMFEVDEIANHLLTKSGWDWKKAVTQARNPYKIGGQFVWG
jgi:hypothetical protein